MFLKKAYLCPFVLKIKITCMLIIDARESDSIDKALKKYKKKFERSGTMKQLRARKYFVKPSVKRRHEILKAAYKQEKYGNS